MKSVLILHRSRSGSYKHKKYAAVKNSKQTTKQSAVTMFAGLPKFGAPPTDNKPGKLINFVLTVYNLGGGRGCKGCLNTVDCQKKCTEENPSCRSSSFRLNFIC